MSCWGCMLKRMMFVCDLVSGSRGERKLSGANFAVIVCEVRVQKVLYFIQGRLGLCFNVSCSCRACNLFAAKEHLDKLVASVCRFVIPFTSHPQRYYSRLHYGTVHHVA